MVMVPLHLSHAHSSPAVALVHVGAAPRAPHWQTARHRSASSAAAAVPLSHVPSYQGLTLVHFSAQLKRILCDRGCS